MKTVIIPIFITILTTSLLARENPFIPTQTFIEKQKQLETKTIVKMDDENISDEIIEEKKEDNIVQELPIHYKVLPFIQVSTLSDKLIIDIKDKYKLINQDINHKEKKFVFDFRGKLNIYTKRVHLNHKAFKSIIIGTHKKHNFFRVVVILKDKLANYEEDLDTDNSIITITKIK